MPLPEWAQGPPPDKFTGSYFNPLDHDAPYGAVSPEVVERESRRNNRTLAFAAVGVVAIGAFVGGTFLYAANQHPNNTEASAEPFPSASSTPSATETSASPKPSKSSTSPKPSPSKTSASPKPSKTVSPSAIPSSETTTHKVILPSASKTPKPSAPETHSSAPTACHWLEQGAIVTVGECGDHRAYNDTNRSGEHTLSSPMQFERPCLLDGMVEIHYGGGKDYLEDHGYFPVDSVCN